MLEGMAINIADLFYDVRKSIEGPLAQKQTGIIAELLEGYKNRNNPLTPKISHYERIRNVTIDRNTTIKTHVSDYYLIDEETNKHHLVELRNS